MVSAAPTRTKPQPPGTRRRLLLFCYSCDPSRSAESRVGWARALAAARRNDVTVVCGPQTDRAELRRRAEAEGVGDRLRFVVVSHGAWGSRCYDSELLYLLGYRMWQARAARIAARLHERRPFDLVHQVNFCGFREPGYGWRIDAPFVWGPVGGTEMFPLAYLPITCPMSGAREVLRNLITKTQLLASRRLRRVADRSAALIAATESADRAFRESLREPVAVELEAGLDIPNGPERGRRDTSKPLRILWTGRLRAWKGLPLLLDALSQLPAETPVEVRVLGEGPCENMYRKRAKQLGGLDKIEWAGWGPYEQTLPHYQWADVFVFTSLRDTSGAGLLEALAAGAPIVGLHHQGAADLFDEESGVPLELSSPRQTSGEIAAALGELAKDPERLARLSRGAQQRAERYRWPRRERFMEEVYQRFAAHGGAEQLTDGLQRRGQAGALSNSRLASKAGIPG